MEETNVKRHHFSVNYGRRNGEVLSNRRDEQRTRNTLLSYNTDLRLTLSPRVVFVTSAPTHGAGNCLIRPCYVIDSYNSLSAVISQAVGKSSEVWLR